MERKTVTAEIGTTREYVTMHLSGDAKHDIAEAVEHEHYCNDNHCDIRHALEAGYPYSAAYLLSGATETPLLDAVCHAYGFDPASTYDKIPDWEDWTEYFRAESRPCPCGSYIIGDNEYTCDNCGSVLPARPDDDLDAFIHPVNHPNYGYGVTVEGTLIGTYSTQDEAESALWHWTHDNGYYPETWFVNERGNTTLLARNDSGGYDVTDISYV
jgi:hypothetical protein